VASEIQDPGKTLRAVGGEYKRRSFSKTLMAEPLVFHQRPHPQAVQHLAHRHGVGTGSRYQKMLGEALIVLRLLGGYPNCLAACCVQ